MQIHVLLEPDQTPDQLTRLALLCEQVGISTMWLQNYVACRDPFMALVPAALATRRVRLGVCVVSPWEMHPVKMANSLLTLHEYSSGRAGLVIGGGGEWPARLGIEVVKRVRAVREAIELVRRGCSGQALTYQGELYKVYGYRPKFGIGGGIEQPPLVYTGANQPQMLRATVPAADGVMYSDMTRRLIATTVTRTGHWWRNKGDGAIIASTISGPGISSRTRRLRDVKPAGNYCAGLAGQLVPGIFSECRRMRRGPAAEACILSGIP
ncbi:MAG: LLM class flavin-dependent oxidoreductase [Gammaproteobacteria bacterium]